MWKGTKTQKITFCLKSNEMHLFIPSNFIKKKMKGIKLVKVTSDGKYCIQMKIWLLTYQKPNLQQPTCLSKAEEKVRGKLERKEFEGRQVENIKRKLFGAEGVLSKYS